MSEINESGLITICDEDGIEYQFEQLDALETEEGQYVALLPVYGEEDGAGLEEDGELVILKVLDEDGEEVLSTIDDDEESDRISEIFISRLSEFYEIDETEE